MPLATPPVLTLPLPFPQAMALEADPSTLTQAFKAFQANDLPLYELLGLLETLPSVAPHQPMPPVLCATVEGDVHEVGKHLAEIFMTALGIPHEDLGVQVTPETLLDALAQKPYTAVVVSGLLYEGANRMSELAQALQKAGCRVPLIVASCGMTPEKALHFVQSYYTLAPVMFAPHALGTVQWLKWLHGEEGQACLSHWHEVGQPLCPSPSQVPAYRQSPEDLLGDAPAETYTKRHEGVTTLSEHAIPTPPFWGFKQVETIALENIYPFVNARTLYTGHWGFRRGQRSSEAFKTYLEAHAAPILDGLKQEMLQANILQPKVIYGYTPCKAQGNTLYVYRPEDAHSSETCQDLEPWHTFTFPRGGAKALCLTDYISETTQDVLAWQIVTMGSQASHYLRTLLQQKRYQAYYTCHGFFVEMAEALAEYWHQVIRRELDIHHQDATDMQAILSMDGGYQGCRYSFGYPACPDMREQEKLFEMLVPEQIGITLTRNWMQAPEQSTCALIFHHPEAHYFDVRQWQG
ncbi:MAG: vitamin B12 dependent-methionine synthase activation domain-containing protein [Vampirovibrionales bacterium]